MLRVDLMIRADDGPLEQRPHAFDGVGVNVCADVGSGAVVDSLVPRVFVGDTTIAGMLVGVDRRSLGFGGGLAEGVERLLVGLVNGLEPDGAATLDGSDDCRLVRSVIPALDARFFPPI